MNFQINDWPLRKFMIVVMSILVVFIGLWYLEPLNTVLSVFKGIIGFFILTFIPGFVILRILKLHYMGNVKSLLFSVGLSLSYMMVLGVAISIIYPVFGFLTPISSNSLIFTVLGTLVIMLFAVYVMDRNFIDIESKNDYSDILNPYVLLAIFILFLGIFGVYMVNLHDNNLFLMIFILITSFIPILISFRKISNNFYPLIIFLISLALLYQTTLFSNFLIGSDIFSEFYFANFTSINQIWNPTMNHQLNSALSIALIPSFYKIVCGLDIIWYFKLVSQFFFALMPVGLYYMYDTSFKGDLTKKEKLFAVFFVIFLWYFYILVTGMVRQELAEFFFVLLFIVIFTEAKRTENISYNFIFVLFGLSLIFSQYSLANLFLYLILIFVVVNAIFGNRKKELNCFGLNYVILFFVMTLSWNMFIANGSVFKGMVLMGNSILNVYTDFFSPQINVSTKIVLSSSINIIHSIYRGLYYFILLCMAVGGVILLRNLFSGQNKIVDLIPRKLNLLKFNKTSYGENRLYEMVAFSNYSLLGVYLIVPLIGFQLGFDRVFHITTLILAPYFILGFKNIFGALFKLIKLAFKININRNHINKILALTLSILLLFNSGFVFEVMDDPFPNSASLSLKNINNPLQIDKNEGTLYLKLRTVTDSELKSGEWLSKYYDPKLNRIYTTFGSGEFKVYGIFTPYRHVIQLKNMSEISVNKGYFYYNFANKILDFEIKKTKSGETINKIDQTIIDNQLDNYNKIYSSTGDEIYIIR